LCAVRVVTSRGFELCPADACRVDDACCPAGETAESAAVGVPMFQAIKGFGTRAGDELVFPMISQYERVLATHGIQIAGIEFILDAREVPFTYDININTNYNREEEAPAGLYGMREVAAYLGRELAANEVGQRPRLDSGVFWGRRKNSYRSGSAKLRIRSPPRRPRSPPPEATVTNCSPFTMYTAGDEKTPAPVLNFQSSSPVCASKAKK